MHGNAEKDHPQNKGRTSRFPRRRDETHRAWEEELGRERSKGNQPFWFLQNGDSTVSIGEPLGIPQVPESKPCCTSCLFHDFPIPLDYLNGFLVLVTENTDESMRVLCCPPAFRLKQESSLV